MGNPSPPNGILHLPPDCIPVLDADDETFDIYSTLALANLPLNQSNLGMVDARSDTVEVALVVRRPLMSTPSAAGAPSTTRRSRSATKKTKAVSGADEIELSFTLGQSLQRLKGSGGETGSVLWRSSLHLLSHILPGLHFSSPFPSPPLLSLSNPSLRTARVLELGSGTALLPIALHSFVASWTATDLPTSLSLILQNLRRNGVLPKEEDRVVVTEYDWLSPPASLHPPPRPASSTDEEEACFDLVLAVDCIYNEHLARPLARALTRSSAPGRTVALVVLETRSEDVVREWLSEWLGAAAEEGDGRWEVWRLPNSDGEWGEGGRFVGWVGWRTAVRTKSQSL